MANVEWRNSFKNAEVVNKTFRGSGHSPINLDLGLRQRKRSLPFKFEAGWNEIGEYIAIVEKIWVDLIKGSSMCKVMSKLKACRAGLYQVEERVKKQ